MSDLMQMCVDNVEIKKYIKHFGGKIHFRYPTFYAFEDAENELWAGVFKRLSKKYNPEIPLDVFAKRAIFSHYGSIIKLRGNKGKHMHENAISLDKINTTKAKTFDSAYAHVDVSFTLDQIAKDLKDRAERSRQYRFTVAKNLFGLLRKGYSIRFCCEQLHVSHMQGYRVYNEIICGYGKKYKDDLYGREHDETITTRYR